MVFRQSMCLCKVRTAHVVRVWAYSVPVVLAWFTMFYAVVDGCHALLSNWAPANKLTYLLLHEFMPVGRVIFIGTFAASVIWSMRCGYRHYINMPHAFWVALASQLIAALLTLLLAFAMIWRL